MLLTTQDMDDIEALCSRVMLINHGRLLRDGTRVVFGVRDAVPAFVAAITGGYAVRDLMVSHPPIEELVAALYRAPAVPYEAAPAESTG